MATALSWSEQGIKVADVDRALAELRANAAADHPSMRTSVMTHIAWVPERWADQARRALAGMAEQHPSRTILLFPDANAGESRLDGTVSLETYQVPGSDRHIVTEVIELRLLGPRAQAPASIVLPLLISDLPVFLRWRGEPLWGSDELRQLVAVVDRLVVDSTEWDGLPHGYGQLARLFDDIVVSDIAWARTSRWRRLLASLWPDIASVGRIRVRGTHAQALLLGGWLRSRLDRDDIGIEHVEAERLEGIDLDGKPAPFPPGDPPTPSDVLSEELETYGRDRIYEDAVRAAASG
jgi:hypothetical protein